MLVITCEGETTKINTSSSKNIYFLLLLLAIIINVMCIYMCVCCITRELTFIEVKKLIRKIVINCKYKMTGNEFKEIII